MTDTATAAGKNANLHSAKTAKNDEFYTQLTDIEAEVAHYVDPIMPGAPIPEHWRNPFLHKTVLLNCDDPAESNFWRYFVRKFDDFQIGRLIATHYTGDGSPSYAMILDRDADGAISDYGLDAEGMPAGKRIALAGDGDFRSPECLAFLDECDVVVTNPPFSLLRAFLAEIIARDKAFLFIANPNAITYKEVFPLIRENKLWLGNPVPRGSMWFTMPDDQVESIKKRDATCFRYVDGQAQARRPACWFTNLDHRKRHEDIDLVLAYEGHEDEYPRYDNYDAINVDKVNRIPYDYAGIMGVPITFLDKFNPEQFEIIGLDRYTIPKEFLVGGRAAIDGKPKYARILIRNRRPEPKFEF